MSQDHDVKLEVRHLKLLAAVAEKGSVTEAGRYLHVTQSALSHQLRDAEEKLGTALFLRLGRKMVLTTAGEKLLESAHKVLDELRQAETQIASRAGSIRGAIRVSTECYTCYHWLPPVVEKFHAKFPAVDVNILLEETSRPFPALLDGRLDVVLTTCPPRNKSLQLTPMCDDELVLIMKPQHRLASLAQVHGRDLAGESVVCYPPKEDCTLLQEVMRPAGAEPRRIMDIPLTGSIVDMVSSGWGVALMARWAIKDCLDSGRLVARSLNNGGIRRRWYAVTLRSQPVTPYFAEFLKLLVQTWSLDSAPS
ncbi:MAG TPA: LysR substrate-binding domain-containing protein [Candidatus Sulfotelmatobacter sp.]|nr:LysR substrate-binding domain-containing protein [Candidatus Sulfotelmatobacter sp.]